MKRRRAQNRSAQRAFRHRQVQRVKLLEAELNLLQQSHDALSQVCNARSEEIERLKTYIQELTRMVQDKQSCQSPSLDRLPTLQQGSNHFEMLTMDRTIWQGMEDTFETIHFG